MLPLPDGILINGRGTNQTAFDFERGTFTQNGILYLHFDVTSFMVQSDD